VIDTSLVLGGREFAARLIVGTGKFGSHDVMRDALEESGAEIVVVAIRRLTAPGAGDSLLDHIDAKRYTIVPTTAGSYTGDEAIRTAYLAREAGLGDMVELDITGDPRTLFPDAEALIATTRTLARDGFTVLAYTTDDPLVARRLQDAGAAAVMPLGAAIGSGVGVRNAYNLKLVLESVSIPVIVSAGIGTASDAAIAMELGCDGVAVNTAIAAARDPAGMARAMKLGVEAGRLAYRSGRISQKLYATAPAALEGVPDWTT